MVRKFGETCGNQLQHKQLTFPLQEESCKQLKQAACHQHVTSKEQAGKQAGAWYMTDPASKQTS
ncbi:hypothetical protein F2Q69_00035879 [Brassica cretica]|uniref:Uncharacterized protein n=1 Tax=Brassica cretica TaxID=69181 RepID=A0A8S9SMQ3_BRACR|nr:hypothetical protein F2Q69_00035879 [Brassica cretica]